MENFAEQAIALGLSGQEAVEYVREQSALLREQRAEERAALAAQREAEAAAAQRQAEAAERAAQREAAERAAERAAQREAAEREAQRIEAERQREHEREMRRIGIESSNVSSQQVQSKPLKLPQFIDGTDSIDSYLQRFERFARTNDWPEESWAARLSTLLTGAALDAYSRLSDEDSVNYSIIKSSLLRKYNFTEEG